MTCAAELFTSLTTLKEADTGATGLHNAASAAYVPTWFRLGDSNDRGLAKPRIDVEIIEDETDRFPRDSIEVLVRFHVATDLLWRFGSGERNQNSVVARMRSVFHRVALAGQTTWTFTQMSFRGVVQLPADVTANELRLVVNARVTAREV